MHSMQAGYLEKAQKYTDKALMQLEKLKSKSGSRGPSGSVAPWWTAHPSLPVLGLEDPERLQHGSPPPGSCTPVGR